MIRIITFFIFLLTIGCLSPLYAQNEAVVKASQPPFMLKENKENNGVYAFQKNLIGKIGKEGINLTDEGLAFFFTGRVRVYVSMRQLAGAVRSDSDTMIVIPVTDLPVVISPWREADSRLWPVGFPSPLTARSKLSDAAKSSDEVELSIRAIQPVFAENGDLVMLRGQQIALLQPAP